MLKWFIDLFEKPEYIINQSNFNQSILIPNKSIAYINTALDNIEAIHW